VSIGVAEGEEAYQLFGVTDAYRREDGSIAVLDRSRSLRLFDRLGVHLWTAGRRGDGPGEFGYPQRITEISGDSLVVWDLTHSRVTVFSGDGALGRTLTVPELMGSSPSLGLAAPGQLLHEHRVSERTLVDGHPAIVTDSELVLLEIGAGSTAVIGREFWVTQFQDPDGAFGPATFAVPAAFAVVPNGYWYGDTREYEVRRGTASGLEVVLRWQGRDRSVSDADLEALIRHWAGGAAATPERERSMREYGMSMPRADRFPAYEELLTDAADRLWVKDYVREAGDDGLRRWTIFSSGGTEVLGRFFHSASFRPLQMGTEWVLGVDTDPLGVERVVLREIVYGSGRDSS
jgi:hypothetical protein